MSTFDLKKSVQKYIETADDRLLKMIKALVESYQEDDYEISEENKAILNEREETYKANPDDLLDWKDVKDNW